ncbi:MAG: hypothetical protein C5B59_03225 [Bacteroidetes bacterium]|nr:MAG: hypothetical protein C5B59_03225 [Bacteroidota bacterium]
MKTQIDPKMVYGSNHRPITYRSLIDTLNRASRFIFSLAFILSFVAASAQSKDCKDCKGQSFASITTYYALQQGSNIGFGFEGGTWNKEKSRFSYFLGAKLQWFNDSGDKLNNAAEIVHYSVYVKGQFEIINRLYVIAAPEFVNLSTFETRAGIRYVYPITHGIGIGVEPAYSFVQKQYSLNANIHFAMW